MQTVLTTALRFPANRSDAQFEHRSGWKASSDPMGKRDVARTEMRGGNAVRAAILVKNRISGGPRLRLQREHAQQEGARERGSEVDHAHPRQPIAELRG